MNQVEVRKRQIEVFSYFIGLMNLLIFARLLGDNGIAYLIIALEGFCFLWTVTGGSLADSLGRLLRSRNAKGQYRNASDIRKRAFLFQGILGAAGSILFAVCSGPLAQYVFKVQYSSLIMAVLAPALFLRVLSSVVAGCFQGEGSELPAAVSVVLRQALVMGFGLLFANLMRGYGEKVSNLLGEQAYTAMYGGVGVAIGMDLAELLVLLFLGLIYFGNRRALTKKQGGEGLKRTDSFLDTVRVLYGAMGIPMLLQLFWLLPLWLGAVFFRKSAADTAVFSEAYGLFAGKYLVILGLAVLLVYLSLIAANARTVGYLRREDQRSAKTVFQGGLQMGVAQSLFWVGFAAVMAEQISGSLCGEASKSLTGMFRFGSGLIIFAALGLYFARALMLTGRRYPLLACLGLAAVMFTVVCSVVLNLGKQGVMSLVFASLASGGTLCLVLGFLCCRMFHAGIDWLRVLVIPAAAASVTGLLSLLLGKALTPHLGNLVTLIVCFVPAFVVYWVILLLLRCFREQELRHLPGGKMLRGAGQILRVF